MTVECTLCNSRNVVWKKGDRALCEIHYEMSLRVNQK